MENKQKNTFEIGQIIGFHGIKGEMKVKSFSDSPERFAELESVIVDRHSYRIANARTQKGYAFIRLEGINDRTAAEKLRNKIVSINREDAGELEEDEYFVADLINYPVVDRNTGDQIGTLKEINQTSGPVDNFVIDTVSKDIIVPALKEYFKIDQESRKILAEIPKEFFEL